MSAGVNTRSAEPLKVGDRVVPNTGPWVGSIATVEQVHDQRRIVVRFDNEPRATRGVGFYDGQWLTKVEVRDAQ